MPVTCSIVIPNWNGESFIARCVAATIQSAQASGQTWELVILDDASTDCSPDIITREFPGIRFIRNSQNLGFGRTCNLGAETAQGEFIVFLNNDLVPKQPMIGELVSPLLENREVFGVSGKTIDWAQGKPNHANMAARWKSGGFELVAEQSESLTQTMFLQGGSCAMRREAFLTLGGFCHLFAPGYWEDYDISYLALKCGWKNIYNPAAEAHHLGQGSMIRAYGDEHIQAIRQRNAFLFTWCNLTDPDLLRQHLATLPNAMAKGCVRPGVNRAILRGIMRAARLRKMVTQERNRRQPMVRLTDREVLEPFKLHGEALRQTA